MRQHSPILLVLVLLAACTCQAGIIHVPGDWPTIAAGVDAASFGDTVVVAGGYYEEHDIEMKSGVWVRSASGNASSVTIDAADSGRVFSFEATEQPCGIEGLTITRGLVERYGGAVYCSEGTAAFRNCTFALNVAGGSMGDMGVGGALYAELSTVTIDGCEFHDNSVTLRGGAVCSVTTDLTVESSVFVHNMGAAWGGGIYSGSGPLEVVGCEFRDNMAWAGGAVTVHGYGSVATIRDCRFDRNWGRVGGGGALLVWWPTSFVAEDCAFFENETGGYGGSAALWSGFPSTFIGCSFVRSTGQGAPAVYVEETAVSLENCIVAFTTEGAAVACGQGGTATLSCSDVCGNAYGDWVGCIEGQLGVDGNFFANPLFCDLKGGDLTINENSPCTAENSPCGKLVGAYDVGCPVSAVEEVSWGRIKSIYR